MFETDFAERAHMREAERFVQPHACGIGQGDTANQRMHARDTQLLYQLRVQLPADPDASGILRKVDGGLHGSRVCRAGFPRTGVGVSTYTAPVFPPSHGSPRA